MSERKRKKKSYYVQAKRNCVRQQLEADLKGFLITCGNKSEKQAVREAYNILNEYADKLYGEEVKADMSSEPESGEMDIAKAIALQVGDKSSSKESVRRFQAVDTKTNNCVFIKTTLEHPDELLSVFLSDIVATGVTKSRFILKIFPVMGTCRASEDKIEKLTADVLQKLFSDKVLGTYAVMYKVRCNNLGREHILPLVGRAVQQICPGSKVDLENPDHIISVDVLNKFCCVSVMKDFYKLKKFNIQELGKLSSCTVRDCSKPNESEGLAQVAAESSTNDKLELEHVGFEVKAKEDSNCVVQAAFELFTSSQDSSSVCNNIASEDCTDAV